ncbi:hypothetical protein ACFU8X_09095 [Brevibacillus porteri]|uniref:hypothetical protein n=1 Tax=Brevibacillus porteri TaxID=2126350 RepID=UPI00370CAD35
METFIQWSVIALWVFVIVQFVVIYLLTKLVADFINKLQAKEKEPSVDNWIGSRAPVLIDNSPSGTSIDFTEMKSHSTLALFTAEGCPICQQIIPHLEKVKLRFPQLKLLVVYSGKLIRETQNQDDIQYIDSAISFSMYQIDAIPSAVLIDKKGIILAKESIPTFHYLLALLEKHVDIEADTSEFIPASLSTDLGENKANKIAPQPYS